MRWLPWRKTQPQVKDQDLERIERELEMEVSQERERQREIELPRDPPILANQPKPVEKTFTTPVFKVERPKEKKLQYLKIDDNSGKINCSCGANYTGSGRGETNWWIMEHLVKGCEDPQAEFERAFQAASSPQEA